MVSGLAPEAPLGRLIEHVRSNEISSLCTSHITLDVRVESHHILLFRVHCVVCDKLTEWVMWPINTGNQLAHFNNRKNLHEIYLARIFFLSQKFISSPWRCLQKPQEDLNGCHVATLWICGSEGKRDCYHCTDTMCSLMRSRWGLIGHTRSFSLLFALYTLLEYVLSNVIALNTDVHLKELH